VSERRFRVAPAGWSVARATGDLIPDRKGTAIRVVEWLPAWHVVLNFIGAPFVLSLWIIPELPAIAAGTDVPYVPWFVVLGTVIFVVFSLATVYDQAREDRAILRTVLESVVAEPPIVPADPSLGSQRAESRRGQWVGVAAVLLLLAIVGLSIYIDNTINDPPAARMQNVVRAEFDRVPPVPGAITVDAHASHKPGIALADATYRTTDDYRVIRAHYDAVLGANGWSFRTEEPLTNWGRDLGGKAARYCKGNLEADLDYAGERANSGWTYAFSVTWGEIARACK
jgi:hypothetical protein